MLTRLLACLLIAQSLVSAAPAWTPEKNETVVLLGDTFFERDYTHGYLETALTVATAGNNIRFRNLGWSGDTPRCESRSYFGPPAEGFDRLRKQLTEIKPTTAIVCYGAVDAFEGQAGVESFLASYKKLLQMLQSTGITKIVLLSPPAVSRDDKQYPSLSQHNAERERYSKAIQQLASEQSLGFGDLFLLMKDKDWKTIHGITYTSEDYQTIAPLLLQSLGLTLPKNLSSHDSLRSLILEKNHLFFQRWRPQNEIYLFGSRKHEQGRNGAEIPQFDPLIEQKEQQIFTTISAK